MSLRKTYSALVEHVKKYKVLHSVSALAEWDELVMMPPKAAESRGLQSMVLSSIRHDMETDPKIGSYLSELVDESNGTVKSDESFNEFEISNILLIRREYIRNTKITKELVEKASELQSRGYHQWVVARKESDWSKFAEIMQEWINIRKEMALLINPKGDVYDTLLDEYDPELSSEKVEAVFNTIKKELIPLIQAIRNKVNQEPEKYSDDALLKHITADVAAGDNEEGKFPIEKQVELSKQVAQEIGFDFDSGRLDVSVHPFSTSFSINDLRITSRYDKNEFLNGLTSTIHETGHSLYEGGLNKEYAYQPVHYALGMAIHESQSLFWERHVGLNLAFWKKWYPVVESLFPYLKEKKLDVENDVFRAVNTVVLNNFIRVESDELTYPMHVILRFEIEKALFNGSLSVADVPKVWNQKMKEYLGLEVPSDSKGALQDVHWSSGSFGYFPTYSLGAIAAAQIAHSIPNHENLLANNDYPAIKKWLNENIHNKGSLTLNSNALLKQVTGEELNPQIYIKYLKEKYSKLYNL